MTLRALTLLAAMVPVAASSLPVLPEAPHDMLHETLPSGDTSLVLRYLLPDLTSGQYDAVLPMLDTLCARDGLPAWAASRPHPGEIVVIVMDRAIPRGQPMPGAIQYISAYVADAEGKTCLWQ